MSDQQPDTRPGFYYVSVIDGPKRALAFGPFVNDHGRALADVDRVRALAEERDPRAAFYAFGTCRSETDLGPGVLGTPALSRNAPRPAGASGDNWAHCPQCSRGARKARLIRHAKHCVNA